MVCEVCRTGPEGVIEQGALWASEGTRYESTKEGKCESLKVLFVQRRTKRGQRPREAMQRQIVNREPQPTSDLLDR